MRKPWENDGLMESNGIYPLVVTSIALENHHVFHGKFYEHSTISSNFPEGDVHLPEGNVHLTQ